MAREESDREDLLREATALVERVELRVPNEPEPVTAGFRRDGAASFFFGADPVFQFNASGELRRAFVGGKLLKAERGLLVELTRVRTRQETQLVRREFDPAESSLFLSVVTARLAALHKALSGPIDVIGRVPTDVDVTARVRVELQRLCESPKIAASPRVGK